MNFNLNNNRTQVINKQIQLVWEGDKPLINTLYFGTRKKSTNQQEINQIKELFKKLSLNTNCSSIIKSFKKRTQALFTVPEFI